MLFVGMLSKFEGDGMAPTQLSPLLTQWEPHSCIQFTTFLLFYNTCPHFQIHRKMCLAEWKGMIQKHKTN